MNNLVEKSEENVFKSMWGKIVEKEDFSSFTHFFKNFSAENHTKSTAISTCNLRDFSLLNLGFPHFPHSLLLLLLNN